MGNIKIILLGLILLLAACSAQTHIHKRIPPTTSTSTTTTTIPPPTTIIPVIVKPKPVYRTPIAAPATRTVTLGYGCQYALPYLRAHAAPGFELICPGYAEGHQAMSCNDVPNICPGYKEIVIHDPCPAAYENEAYNSWIVAGYRSGSYDPYGHC